MLISYQLDKGTGRLTQTNKSLGGQKPQYNIKYGVLEHGETA